MTSTQAAAAQHKASKAMWNATDAHDAEPNEVTEKALAEAVRAYKDASATWASAYVLEGTADFTAAA